MKLITEEDRLDYDRRVRYTLSVITESISDLVMRKPFHSITLTEVCGHAGIHRSTFYKHYYDIYDWKRKFEDHFLKEAERTADECSSGNTEEKLTLELDAMRRNEKLYRMASSPNFESNVMEQMVTMFLEKADRRLKEQGLAPERWDSHYIIKGCLGAIECWVNEGMEESPSELARFLSRMIAPRTGTGRP